MLFSFVYKKRNKQKVDSTAELWYNIHKAAFGAADESAGASPQPCGY